MCDVDVMVDVRCLTLRLDVIYSARSHGSGEVAATTGRYRIRPHADASQAPTAAGAKGRAPACSAGRAAMSIVYVDIAVVKHVTASAPVSYTHLTLPTTPYV